MQKLIARRDNKIILGSYISLLLNRTSFLLTMFQASLSLENRLYYFLNKKYKSISNAGFLGSTSDIGRFYVTQSNCSN